MPSYRVVLDAKNFLIDMDGRVSKRGFITWRFVEAPDADNAELAAVQMIRDDQELRSIVKNNAADPPVIDVDEIYELEAIEEPLTQPGRIWYEMDPKRWWQFWRRK